MGKRPKKKMQGGPVNKMGTGSRASSSSASSSTASESGRLMENGAAVDTAGCSHGPNLDKLRSQLAKSTAMHCLDCAKLRSVASAGKERKGKGKVVRRKLPSSSVGTVEDKNSMHKLWVCLCCGHVGCGVENPNFLTSNIGGELNKQEVKQGIVGRGHAWQHWLQLKHPMVMLCGDKFSCWCFLCESVHEVAHHLNGSLESGDSSPVEGEEGASTLPSRVLLLQQSAKLIQEKLAEQFANAKEDSEEPRTGAEETEKQNPSIELERDAQEEPEAPTKKRVMKGLINLGNTCFFNSVMQNLLSLELLRNHFGVESSLPEGALTHSLRKFFQDASAHSLSESNAPIEAGAKKSAKARGGWSPIDGPYNPKGLFGAICSKAPRFKGFQQQDSHELLRCLLDGLHTEEESARKASSLSKSGGGEDALRALSETEADENGSNTQVDDLEDSGAHRQDAEVRTEDVAEKTPIRKETFVERVFGGQLSSTVSCCECGHSSVVYESFLDLSLPIPSKKPSSKKISALENGSSAAPAQRQRVQTLKGSKLSSKTDPDLEVFRSIPAGLGTPLLLLPPPPPKDKNGDFTNAGSGSDCGWLDFVDPGTGSGEADWLDFVDDGREVDPGTTLGCSLNPASQLAANTAPSLDSEIGFGFGSDLDSMKEPSVSNGILGPPAAVSQCIVESQPNGGHGSSGLFFVANGNVADQSLDIPLCEKFLLLEAAPEAISEVKNRSMECGSGLRPPRSQETDVQVQMRGGSESQIFDSTEEAEMNNFPVAEQLIDTGASVEQSADGNDDRRLESDIINGPNGTVILLGPPVDSITYSNLGIEGEYDGVGSLFDEEDNGEDRLYGPPLPLNRDEAGFEETTYDEIVFDDVLDLSKSNSEGRADWLVSNEERQGEENDEAAMSIEGCLQIFTRSELLSGENAWACENCTKQYQEKLAIVPVKALVTSPQTHLVKTNVGEACPELSGKKGIPVGQVGRKSQESAVEKDTVVASKHTGNGSCKDDSAGSAGYLDAKVDGNGEFCGNGSDSVKSGLSGSCRNPIAAEGKPSAVCGVDVHVDGVSPSGHIRHLLTGAKDGFLQNEMGHESFQEHLDNTGIVDKSAHYDLEPADLKGVGIRSEPNAEIPGKEISALSDTQVESFWNGVDGDVVTNHNREPEANASQPGKRGSQVNTRSSCKTSKLKKSKSRKVPGEQKKVIKQDATKRFLISRAPPVLTIQLKRFAQDMRGRLSKLSGHIAFQEWLDLHPFLDRRHVNYDCKYRLIGTVEHSGTLKSGHYVAFVRGPPALKTTGLKTDVADTPVGVSSWYYVSDSHVHQTNLEAVLQSEAYLVFYERVDTALDVPL